MEALLDFDKELDIGLLDRVVNTMFTGRGQEQQMAQQILTQFQEHPDAWTRVDAILETSNIPQTKFIALQVLEKLIQTRWKILPREQCQGIRNFIVAVIIKVSSDETTLHKERAYVNKLNLVLVQILKQEWPLNWPSFIPEIVSSSKTNVSLCENNMSILKLLSEEIFDYSAEQMTTAKTKNLKSQMCGEFSEIFYLCNEVLERAQKPSLIKATLETLLRFLNWIPLGYIFETNIINTLRERFLDVPTFRNVTLKCLSEIASLSVGPEYNEKFIVLFNSVMYSVNKMLPVNTDIAGLWESSSDADQEFIQNLAIFLVSFLSAHLKIIESQQSNDVLLNAHHYLTKISQVDERELFKICLEYWSKFVAELYEEIQQLPLGEMNPILHLSMNTGIGAGTAPSSLLTGIPLRKHIYAEVLSNLRVVMIERMVKPEEVLVVENDEGEVVRETLKESDTINLYKNMKEVLVYLTHLDVLDTENIMSEKLAKQIDGSEWSWANLNTLCWAIGSISGAMNEETEKRFLVTVIKDLLGLTEMKKGKSNKAIVAANIMYIVGQYPRFLKAHWKFLKTVVNKLFEFMHETHEGVQDMACDTFIKIANKCRRHFVTQQSGEHEPFIDEILRNLPKITSDLAPTQVHTFYEAVGHMIAAQGNKQSQERLIAKLMEMPNQAWTNVMQEAQQNPSILESPDTIKMLGNILKTNVAACSSIGGPFYTQITRIYMDMLALYKAVSELISDTIANQGLIATKTPKVRGLRTVKKEVLKLLETFVSKTEELDVFNDNLLGPLFEAVLGDYNRNIPMARDAEVLNVMAAIVNRLGPMITEKVPPLLDATFECTLNMINQDFSEFPEHRACFFKLLRAIATNCFQALLKLPPMQFKLVIDSVVWAFKHTMRDIADTGLSICQALINHFADSDPRISSVFFQQYYLSLLQDVFFVLTDTDHKSGFKLQCMLLARMFQLVESGAIQAPLFDPSTEAPGTTNPQFLRKYVVNLLTNAFPHLQAAQIQVFVNGLFGLNQDISRFKINVRDFLIQLKEFAGEDNADLYLEEKEREAAAKEQAERERALAVPGLIKPSELPSTMDEEL